MSPVVIVSGGIGVTSFSEPAGESVGSKMHETGTMNSGRLHGIGLYLCLRFVDGIVEIGKIEIQGKQTNNFC